MTNVQSNRRRFDSGLLLAFGLAAVAMNAMVSAAHAQGPSIYSDSSGGASEVIDVNRRSFGMNFRMGHAGGDTFGRQDSLTHMSLAPYFNTGPALIFADARLGRANKGGLTWAFGGGLRTFVEEWDVVTGLNFYHNRDDITGVLLQTWGLGVEVLDEDWEVRANYIEPRQNTSQLVSQTIDQASAMYSGNNIIFDRIDTVAEALEKIDLEVGTKLPSGSLENVKLRGFVGTYRFEGATVQATSGWKTRLQADIGEYLELNGGLHQDSFTDTTVFFNAVVTFGGFKAQDYTKNSSIHRLADPVRRDLVVPSLRTNVVAPGQVAIDPDDGLPLEVVHVDVNDNVGPFIGTVDDPLMSITAALGMPTADVVFVHAGGLYNAAPDNMVTLANGQDLYGEGLIPAATGDRIAESTVAVEGLGELTLPSSPTFIASGMTLLRPTLQGAAGDSVTLADNSRFGAMIVDGAAGDGIASNGVGGTIISDVLVQNTTGAGIHLMATTDTTTIINTVITGATGPSLHVDGGNGSIGFESTSTDLIPSYANIVNTSQQAILVENMTGGFVNAFGATVSDDGGTGIDILNNASNVTIDNAQLMNSTATGIRIVNSTGVNTFRNSLQSSTLISGATQQSVLIDSLGATGQVTFADLQIDDRNGAGIDIDSNSGLIDFVQPVLIGAPAGGVDAGVSIAGSQATSVIRFSDALTVNGSNGRGIEVSGSLLGSQINFLGPVTVADTTGESISIDNEAGILQFNDGTSITGGASTGVSIQGSTGAIAFEGATSITGGGANSPSVDIQNSEANVLFESLNIANAANATVGEGAGVNLQNNIAGGTNTAIMTFTDVNIQGSGTGFLGLNNSEIRILGGEINTTGGPAIDLEESVWTVRLDIASSLGSPTNGIRLVNAAVPADNEFVVSNREEIPSPGVSGTIQNSLGPAVQLANAGEVILRGMLFESNASGVLLNNSGLADDDDQLLQIQFVSFFTTTGRVIDATNLSTLVLEDSLIDDGGAAIAANTIQLTYNELLNDPDTTTFFQFDNPYEAYIRRNVITDAFDNTIAVFSDPGAEDSHLDLEIINNMMTVNQGSLLQQDTAILLDWTGPSRINIASNEIMLNGNDTDAAKVGIDIVHRSTTDEMLLSVVNNLLIATDEGSIGMKMRTLGQSDILIDANAFTFGGIDSTGMEFNFAPETEFFLQNNQLRFDADGGAGVIFTLVNQPSVFTINNNQIALFDDGALIEEGLRFLAGIGTSNLVGNQNNLIFLLNPEDPNAFIEIPSSFGGSFNGTIIINGAAQP